MSKRDVPEIRKVAGVLSDMANLKNREKKVVGNSASSSASAVKAKVPPSLQGAKKGGKGRFDDCFDFDDTDGFDE